MDKLTANGGHASLCPPYGLSLRNQRLAVIPHRTPDTSKSSFVSPPRSRTTSSSSNRLPKPFCVGGATGGPPLSSQSSCNVPSCTPHCTLTRPSGHDSAPYLLALVASSCSASDSARACLGETSMAAPEIFTCAGVNASRARLTTSVKFAPVQARSVSRS